METEQKNRPNPYSSTPEQGPAVTAARRTPRGELALEPGMSFCQAGRAVMGFHFYRLLANEPGTVRGDDPEPIHDMRVATRRLRAALRAFRPAFGKRALERYVEDVRWLGDMLGKTRDLDVFVEWLEAYEQAADPDLRPYVRRVLQDRKNARARERSALLTALNSPRYQEFSHAFSDFIRDTTESDRCNQKSLGTLAYDMIKRQVQKVNEAGKQARRKGLSSSERLGRLHRLRIQLKRLRYTTEFFYSLMPGEPDKLLDDTQKLQTALGTVHDSAMHAIFLKEVRRVQSADMRMCDTLDRMVEELEQEQETAYKKFNKKYRAFDPAKPLRNIKKRLKQGSAGLKQPVAG